jgi:hypothetical protein
VKSYNEFVDVVKRGKSISHPDNKYWIRGNEWKKDASGNFIKEMFY